MVLAGCSKAPAGGEEDIDPAAFDEFGLETGSGGVIRGVAFDDAIRPIVGATAALVVGGENRTATTNELGAFGFSEVPPGTHAVTVSKPGHLTVTQDVEVVAGVAAPPIVKFQLPLDVESLPYTVFDHFRGYIECAASVVTYEPPTCSWFLPAVAANGNYGKQFHPEGLPDWWQGEMHWSSSQTTADSLSLSYLCTSCGPGGTYEIYGRDRGQSPLVAVNDMEAMGQDEVGTADGKRVILFVEPSGMSQMDVVEEETVHGLYSTATGEECLMYPEAPRLEHTCMEFYGVGAAIQQDFEVFSHMFYGFKPPEGWVFTVDGEPEPPTG